MPAKVHFPEAVLGVNVALGAEEIIRVRGINLRDAPRIAIDRDLALQAGDLDPAVELREGPVDEPPKAERYYERQDEQRNPDHYRPASRLGQPVERCKWYEPGHELSLRTRASCHTALKNITSRHRT
jgi:hypothetical protein